MRLAGSGSDLDILAAGSWSDMIRAPVLGMIGSGRGNSSPKRALKRSARSRVSSRCCFWSSPTGTASARKSRMSAAISTG